jgi:hypothetical protein
VHCPTVFLLGMNLALVGAIYESMVAGHNAQLVLQYYIIFINCEYPSPLFREKDETYRELCSYYRTIYPPTSQRLSHILHPTLFRHLLLRPFLQFISQLHILRIRTLPGIRCLDVAPYVEPTFFPLKSLFARV